MFANSETMQSRRTLLAVRNPRKIVKFNPQVSEVFHNAVQGSNAAQRASAAAVRNPYNRRVTILGG